MKNKITPESDHLKTWAGLNSALMGGDLSLAEGLLKAEKSGKARKQFLMRIHSRINKLRAAAERIDLLKRAGT